MQLLITNCDNQEVIRSIFAQLNGGRSAPTFFPQLNTGQARFWKNDVVRLLISLEAFIGFELSLVPEVERVFVDREQNRNEFRVIAVVNDRDPNVRAKVYPREQAIIEAYPHLDFDFHIIARMNRDLKDIVTGMEKLAFKR